jgi:ligand-binding sensor protein
MAERDNPIRAELDPEQLTIGDLLNESQIRSMRDTFAHSTGIEVVVAKMEPGKVFESPARFYYFRREPMDIPEFNAACMKCFMGTRVNPNQSKDYNIDFCYLGVYTDGPSIWFKDQVVALLGGCMVVKPNLLIADKLQQER